MTTWMTPFGVALIVGGITTLIVLRAALFPGAAGNQCADARSEIRPAGAQPVPRTPGRRAGSGRTASKGGRNGPRGRRGRTARTAEGPAAAGQAPARGGSASRKKAAAGSKGPALGGNTKVGAGGAAMQAREEDAGTGGTRSRARKGQAGKNSGRRAGRPAGPDRSVPGRRHPVEENTRHRAPAGTAAAGKGTDDPGTLVGQGSEEKRDIGPEHDRTAVHHPRPVADLPGHGAAGRGRLDGPARADDRVFLGEDGLVLAPNPYARDGTRRVGDPAQVLEGPPPWPVTAAYRGQPAELSGDGDTGEANPVPAHRSPSGPVAARAESLEGPVWAVPDLPEAAMPELTWTPG